jgi:hypothetical protein
MARNNRNAEPNMVTEFACPIDNKQLEAAGFTDVKAYVNQRGKTTYFGRVPSGFCRVRIAPPTGKDTVKQAVFVCSGSDDWQGLPIDEMIGYVHKMGGKCEDAALLGLQAYSSMSHSKHEGAKQRMTVDATQMAAELVRQLIASGELSVTKAQNGRKNRLAELPA